MTYRDRYTVDRRTAIKTTAGALLGSAVLSESVLAGDTGNNRRQDTFTWAAGRLYEMFDTDLNSDEDESDGDENAHRPLWVIDAMTGTGVEGADHSPHPAPLPGVDHVVPLVNFSAQWHVHIVTDGPPEFNEDGLPTNFTRTDRHGNYLISADAVRSAASDPDDSVTVTPIPGEVFTCPVRPHQHKGKAHDND